MDMEQMVTQLQQEVFNPRAQVAAESGLADAVRAIGNLATAQVLGGCRYFCDLEVLCEVFQHLRVLACLLVPMKWIDAVEAISEKKLW